MADAHDVDLKCGGAVERHGNEGPLLLMMLTSSVAESQSGPAKTGNGTPLMLMLLMLTSSMAKRQIGPAKYLKSR